MPLIENTIAISGFAGRYANCSNVEEFKEGLLNGDDLITSNHSRWPHENLGLPGRLGVIKDDEYFDSTFFGMNPNEANDGDARLRKVLEVTYEALVDAGLNPTELRGSNTGIILAISPNYTLSDLGIKTGILGLSPALMANRISYSLDFNGPSFALDTFSASGLYALDRAAELIRIGRCNIAIICASHLQYDPAESLEFLKHGILSPDGLSRVFDLNRNGYVKSDAVVAIVMQRTKDCKRIYATIVGSGTKTDGAKNGGFTQPSHVTQKQLFEEVYRRYNINPNEVSYVEADGTGTIDGDHEEIKALDGFFNQDRKNPLLIGSVKSNHGNSETAAALVSLSKILIAIHEGMIPANINYSNPDPGLDGISQKRLIVVTDNTPLPEGLIAVNNFGLGGAIATAILKPFTHRKSITNDSSHRLVYVSGRTEAGVEHMLKGIIENKMNAEFLSLIDNIFCKPIENNDYRGYAILSETSQYEIDRSPPMKRPIWFAFSGMGSQWPGMAKDLMQLEVFRKTLRKCANALKPYNIDLEDVVINGTEETLGNAINAFIAITSVSVALTDVLASLGVHPDGIIGHSLGEVACAYADGLTTPEQAVLFAYARGYSSVNSNLIPGLMAAVGMSVQAMEKIIPKDIYIACDNSNDNVTISGPEQEVKKFLQELTSKGIFNKVVNTAGCAYHCPHLTPAAPLMYDMVKSILPEVKKRTKRWLPTAVLECDWETDLGIYNSAEYQLHNYLNRVQFRQVLSHIPKDAIVLEVAPRGLLQAIFKRALEKSITLLPITSPIGNNLEFFLNSMGKLYNAGGQPDLKSLYKPPSFPVSITTPTISNLVKWDHSTQWSIPHFNPNKSFGNVIEFDMDDPNNQFLKGHSVEGRNLIPACGYMVVAWQSFAKMLGQPFEKLPVILEDVRALKATFIPKNEKVVFLVNILKSSGHFEVREKNDVEPCATGRIFVPDNIKNEYLDFSDLPKPEQHRIRMNSDDIYNKLNLHGYNFTGSFQSVKQYDIDGRSGILTWDQNWTVFLDAASQCLVFDQVKGLLLPVYLKKIVIDPQEHLKLIGDRNEIEFNYNKNLRAIQSGAVEIRLLKGTHIKKRPEQVLPTLENYRFTPEVTRYEDESIYDSLSFSLNTCVQIVNENNMDSLQPKICEIASEEATLIIKDIIHKFIVKKTTFYQIDSVNNLSETDDFDMIIIKELNKESNEIIAKLVNHSKFIFTSLPIFDEEFFNLHNLKIVHKHIGKSDTYIMCRKSQPLPDDYTIITVNNNSFEWIEEFKAAFAKYQTISSRIYLVNEDFNSGLLGFFTCIRHEQVAPNLRIFLLRNGKNIERFSVKSDFFQNRLCKDLTVNVYHQNSWGVYCTRFLPPLQKRLFPDAHFLNIVSGLSKGLHWVQKTPFEAIEGRKVTVYMASFTQRDVSKIHGLVGLNLGDDILGNEYSGVDTNGRRVMGLVLEGALATTIQSHPIFTWFIPKRWSFEQAATIPLAYIISYYSLLVRGTLSSTTLLLIHNSTNDESLAAIALALSKQCFLQIVVTSRSEEEVLLKLFPQLQENNIVNSSQGEDFQKLVLQNWKGKGANIVYNCKSIELLNQSMECTADKAHFIELDHAIGGNFLTVRKLAEKNAYFSNISITDIFEENEETLKCIASNIQNDLEAGRIAPLPFTVYPNDEIETAFKVMEENSNKGKCLIKMKEQRGESGVIALPRTYFNPNKSYIVTGGLGGLGLEVAKWLMQRGATKIILNGRRQIYNGYQARCIEEYKEKGATIVVDTSDSTTIEGAESLLNSALNLGPIGGIFNSALVLRDRIISEQTIDDFKAVAAPKIFATQNFDFLTRKLCPDLDYFVVFSSDVTNWGNATQTNYAFANSAMERICECRRAEGLHGLAVEWGPVADAGVLRKLKVLAKIVETLPQKVQSCLDALDHLMQQTEPTVTSSVYSSSDYEERVDDGKKKSVVEAVIHLFGIKNADSLDDSKTLLNLGMDSLLGFEIKHMLEREYDISININEIRNVTIGNLKTMTSV